VPGSPNEEASRLIERLGLEAHPEGGWYRETHRSAVRLAAASLPGGYPGDRSAVTSILFLLPAGARSRWHRVRSEELWLHQGGDGVRLGVRRGRPAGPDAPAEREVLVAPGGSWQAVVPPGWWQEARAEPGPRGWALAGCVVAPGFEFEDFELVGGGPPVGGPLR
jgi:predicted cupin superfamily sugar epimerase